MDRGGVGPLSHAELLVAGYLVLSQALFWLGPRLKGALFPLTLLEALIVAVIYGFGATGELFSFRILVYLSAASMGARLSAERETVVLSRLYEFSRSLSETHGVKHRLHLVAEMSKRLVGGGAAEAAVLAERIRADVEALTHVDDCPLRTRITMSLGIAAYPEHARSASDLADIADRALAAAKQAGRNRVVIWEPEPTEAPV